MAAGEVERTLYDGVSAVAVGKGPEDRNGVGDEGTQGKSPKRSGFWAAGLKRDGLVAEEAGWIVVGRRLLGRWSRREATVWRLVKSGSLVVQGPCHIYVI